MALSRTWYTEANRAADDFSTAANLAKSILFILQAFLRGTNTTLGTLGAEGAKPNGAKWTVAGASDGTTGAMDGSTTRIPGTTFDATKWVRAAANGTAHSWIVLTSPDGAWHFKISYIGASDQVCTLSFAKAAYTGGSNTTDPTSTNETSYTTTSQFAENVASAHRCSMVVDASGNWHFFVSKNGSGFFNYHLMMVPLIETPADVIGTPGVDTWRMLLSSGYEATARGAERRNNGITSYANGNGPLMRTHDGLQQLRVGTDLYVTIGARGDGGTFLDNVITTPNPVSGGFDTMPLWVWSTRASYQGLRGRVPDVLTAHGSQTTTGDGMAVGASEPNSGAQLRTVVGNLLMPFSVVPLL